MELKWTLEYGSADEYTVTFEPPLEDSTHGTIGSTKETGFLTTSPEAVFSNLTNHAVYIIKVYFHMKLKIFMQFTRKHSFLVSQLFHQFLFVQQKDQLTKNVTLYQTQSKVVRAVNCNGSSPKGDLRYFLQS